MISCNVDLMDTEGSGELPVVGVANGDEMMPEESVEEEEVIPEEEEEEEEKEMSEYERKRLERMEENKQMMLATGILQATQKIRAVDKLCDLAAEKRRKEERKSREKPPVNTDLMRKLRTRVAKPDVLDEAINNQVLDKQVVKHLYPGAADATTSKPAGAEILTNLGLRPTATQAPSKKRKEQSNTSSALSNGSSADLTRNMARGLEESESDLSSGDAPPKKVRRSYKGRGGAKSDEEEALRKCVEQLPGFQTLNELVEPKKMCELVNIGLQNDGRGLEESFFSDGSMVDFCRNYNGVKMTVVKKSKMKMLKTWDNRNDDYYVYNSEPPSATNITLTVKGKHNLLMHIDTTEVDDNPHDLETLCRNTTSDIMKTLFCFSNSLPDQVETINQCNDKKKQTRGENKDQHRQQRKLMLEQSGISDKQATRRLAGGAVPLWRGLFPTTSAVNMVMRANPKKTKKQIYSWGVQHFANEPVANATLLQRSAVTYKMSTGMPYLQAHSEVNIYTYTHI